MTRKLGKKSAYRIKHVFSILRRHQCGRLLAGAVALRDARARTTWAGLRASDVGSEEMQAAGDDQCTLMWLNCNRATEEPSPDRGLGIDRWSLSTGHFTILTVISDRGCWFRTASPSLSTLTFEHPVAQTPPFRRQKGTEVNYTAWSSSNRGWGTGGKRGRPQILSNSPMHCRSAI